MNLKDQPFTKGDMLLLLQAERAALMHSFNEHSKNFGHEQKARIEERIKVLDAQIDLLEKIIGE